MNLDKTLLDQGLELMYFGMGTVFVFLTVLVLATTLMSRLLQRFAVSEADAGRQASDSAGVEPRIAAVIAEAVRRHRNRD